VEPAYGVLGGEQDRVEVLDDRVGRQSAGARAEVHRAAGGVEAQPDRGCGVDLGRHQVATAAGEHVVVVRRGRAPGARQPRERSGRCGAYDVLVDPCPHRVERPQPLEQRRVDREAAGHPLVEVVVGVDEARRQQAAGGVDDARIGIAPYVRRRSAGRHRDDPLVAHDDVAGRVLRPLGVDGRDGASVDDDDAHGCRPTAMRTAARMFS
jgi:hypothetical protein